MARAASLLKEGVHPIKSIAAECGYSLVTNFYRDFKQVYGTSPMQMRLMLMEIPLLVDNWSSALRAHSFVRNQNKH